MLWYEFACFERKVVQKRVIALCVWCRSGVGAPVVNECEGEYRHDSRKNILEWNMPLIDQSNKTGTVTSILE